MKKCSRCKRHKWKFYKSKNTPDGLFSWCIACCLLHRKKYKKYAKLYMRKYSKLAKSKELRKIWTSNNIQYLRKYDRNEYQKNKSVHLIRARKRRLKLKSVKGSHTDVEWENLKAKYNYTCLGCGKKEPEIILTRDHVIALSKKGPNYISNILPLCAPCNSKKQTKGIEWYQERRIIQQFKKEK